jgi:glycosyltransferase involved in cell wall biosynthesis
MRGIDLAAKLEQEPLQVVVVCDHAHVSGGLARVAHGSARALARLGHRVTFFTAVPPVDPALAAEGVRVVCLDQPDMLGDRSALAAARRAMWNGEAHRQLAALLADMERGRTIVHLHGWSKALSPSVVAAARRSRLAAVATLHDYVALCPNGALYDYVSQANCTRRPMSVDCILARCDARNHAHKMWRVARQAVLAAAGGPAAIRDLIYMNEAQREIVQPLLPAAVRLHCVPNPVEATDQGPADVAASETFLFVGRLSREKGCVLLAEAARRNGFSTMFMGDGPARAEVAAAAPGATITGWLAPEAVAAGLRSARALVFPSLWYETFGLTVHEALAAGVPVVVSDNTVSAHAVEHGVTGLHFRSGDVADLARQLAQLSDATTARRMGREAYRVYWQAPLTLERHVAELLRVYRRVIGQQSRPHPER